MADEPLGAPSVYGDDRIFVAIVLGGRHQPTTPRSRKLSDAGHPVLRLELEGSLDLGAEFFRWELATATAGAVLGVNPFDEPDVARGQGEDERRCSPRGGDRGACPSGARTSRKTASCS